MGLGGTVTTVQFLPLLSPDDIQVTSDISPVCETKFHCAYLWNNGVLVCYRQSTSEVSAFKLSQIWEGLSLIINYNDIR